MKVLNGLKPGLEEKLYENALVIELRKQGHKVGQQKQFPIFYAGQEIGKLIPELIVHDAVIVDPKVVTASNETRLAQMIGYPAITGLARRIAANLAQHARCFRAMFNMVEAAGIEPASQVNQPAATTCLFPVIFSAMRWRRNSSRTA